AEPRQNVMVIDQGIDTSSPAFRGHIVGTYTDECRDDPPAPDGSDESDGGGGDDAGTSSADGGGDDAGGGDAAPSFEDRKRRYIAALMAPDDSCHLVAGIAPKDDPLPGVRNYRDRWNGMLRGHRYGAAVFSRPEWD